ncbi:MAG: tail fiber domain-containing protein, partial [Flavobacteriales bacterium]|nr:tail fiber domain-containing protein [Flavobacteriales bacterium]
IEWYTDAVQRMRLMPTLTGQTVNGYTGLNLSGHLGLGGPVPTRPLAYIHINSNGSHFAGYRPWMRVGTFMSENNDGMYVGTKREDDDRIDAVLNWFDNDQDSPGVGPDALRFIFTRASSGSSVAAGDDGLEMARLIPVPNGNEGYFGIGDFFTPGLQPAERLDVLNGRVRIRQLPTDPAANTLNRFMVVDNTGVVKWRYLPPSSTTNCDWEMNTGGHLLTTAWRPAGTNGNCPDANWKVGIGTASPQFKMEVIDVEDDSIPTIGGLRVDLRTNHLGWRYGVKSYLEPKHGGVKLAYGAAVQGDIVNAGLDGPGNADAYGVLGRSTTNEDLYLRSSMGVTGTAINSSGTINELLGGDFFGANTGGTVTATYGVRGRAYSNIAGAKCYGVHGTAPVDTNSWAGYFQGKVRATNYMMASMYYTYSDASIKAGVENIEQADVSAKLAALVPRRYHFTPEAQERFGLPAGEQFGFLAQEVEGVFPELVVVSRMPEESDSAGTVIYPEMEVKG